MANLDRIDNAGGFADVVAPFAATATSGARRGLFIGAGWAFVGLGTIGAFIPVMPTTCFMIAALACFAKGSPILARRMLDHPRYGAALRDWQAYRAIPRSAKAVAVASMALSWAVVAIVSATWITPSIVAGFLIAVSLYVVTRPEPPRAAEAVQVT